MPTMIKFSVKIGRGILILVTDRSTGVMRVKSPCVISSSEYLQIFWGMPKASKVVILLGNKTCCGLEYFLKIAKQAN